MNVFGFFSRKPPQAAESVPLPPSPSASTANLSPSAKARKNAQLRTPSPSVDSASAAAAAAAQPRSSSPATKLARLSVDDPTRNASPTRRGSLTALTAIVPTPVFVPPEPTVPSLTAHIGAIPPKILHAYVLARIPGQPAEALPALAAFFAELAPPPKMHCVRCHKDFVEVENDDRSCLVPHDDESAEVERVGAAKRAGRTPGAVGATFETLWGCCGKIVEGDGDQGPPDGWCYEGKHTTDVKRARFRADSTPQQDKLVSCLRKNCHGIRSQLPRGARTTRKRPRSTNYKEATTDEDEDASEGGSDSGMDEITGKTPASARKGRKGKAKAAAEDVQQMDVDEEPAGESASVAGSASGTPRGRGRPPKPKANANAGPASVAKRRVKLAESKVVPGTDGEDDDAASVKSAPTGPTPKRRGRPPKSKPVISDSDREMEVDGTPAQKKEKERAVPGSGGASGKLKTRSLSRTRPGDASDVGASPKPKPRVRKPKEAKDGAAVEGEDKPKKRRKVDT